MHRVQVKSFNLWFDLITGNPIKWLIDLRFGTYGESNPIKAEAYKNVPYIVRSGTPTVSAERNSDTKLARPSLHIGELP